MRQAAALLRCQDEQLWRRIEHYVGQARALEGFEGIQIVGIDETSLRLGEDYITVVHDLDEKRLLFATEGREHQKVVDFASDLKAHGGDPAQVPACRHGHECGVRQGRAAGAAQCGDQLRPLPHDRLAIQAMDEVRRQELNARARASGQGPQRSGPQDAAQPAVGYAQERP